jgi:hypothetical protein
MCPSGIHVSTNILLKHLGHIIAKGITTSASKTMAKTMRKFFTTDPFPILLWFVDLEILSKTSPIIVSSCFSQFSALTDQHSQKSCQ